MKYMPQVVTDRVLTPAFCIKGGVRYDAVVAAVGHRTFADLDLAAITADDGLLFDIKGLWRGTAMPPGRRYRAL
jgi:UDP-N-acetyl-D-mannosaminuronate dehydrogenase